VENNSISAPLRTSPIASSPDAFPWALTVAAIAGMLGVLGIVMIAGIVQFLVAHGGDLNALKSAALGMFGISLQAIAEIAVLIYLALVVPQLAHTSLAGLGFTKLDGRSLRIVAGGIVVMFLVLTVAGSALSNALHFKSEEEAVHVLLSLHTWPEKFWFVIMAAVLAPVFEESVFRLFLFNAMHRWWGFWPAAVTSSVLFGLAHAQAPFVPQMLIAICLPLALGGFVLCWVYATTRNAWAPILTHGVCNLISSVLVIVAPQLAK